MSLLIFEYIELSKLVKQRISKLSSVQRTFLTQKPIYNTALKNAGDNSEIKYVENKDKTERKRKRQRNIFWFNPPPHTHTVDYPSPPFRETETVRG